MWRIVVQAATALFDMFRVVRESVRRYLGDACLRYTVDDIVAYG